MTGNRYHTQPDFSSATFPHQRGTSRQTPPSLWTQMLLPIKSHPFLFFHCHAGLRGVKLLLFKEGFSKVTFSWKHTIANSVSTPDKIVIQLTMVSVLLAWGGKLLLSQLSSLQIWFLPSAHSLIQSLIDVLIMCFRIQSSHDPGLQLCSGQCSEEWSSEWTADNSDIQMQFGTFPGGVMTIMSHRQPLNCLKW